MKGHWYSGWLSKVMSEKRRVEPAERLSRSAGETGVVGELAGSGGTGLHEDEDGEGLAVGGRVRG